MKLEKFLEENKISLRTAAQQLDENYETIRRWSKGSRIPTSKGMQKIFEYTSGAVMPNDFYLNSADKETCNN